MKPIDNDADELLTLKEQAICFFSNQAIKVIKQYRDFRLVKIAFIQDNTELIVDTSLICTVPDNTNTLSLGLLG